MKTSITRTLGVALLLLLLASAAQAGSNLALISAPTDGGALQADGYKLVGEIGPGTRANAYLTLGHNLLIRYRININVWLARTQDLFVLTTYFRRRFQ